MPVFQFSSANNIAQPMRSKRAAVGSSWEPVPTGGFYELDGHRSITRASCHESARQAGAIGDEKIPSL